MSEDQNRWTVALTLLTHSPIHPQVQRLQVRQTVSAWIKQVMPLIAVFVEAAHVLNGTSGPLSGSGVCQLSTESLQNNN